MSYASTRRHSLTAGDALPSWFSSALYVVLVGCAIAGTTALLLLWIGWYHAFPCALIAAAATVAVWRFRPRAETDARAAHGPAIAAVVIALALLALAGGFHSQHLFADRDPAVYINTGRSIARTHRVDAKIAPGPFDNTASFSAKSSGFTIGNHRLHPDFLDFLPALLALGWSAGGDTALLLVPALLGAIGLLTVYALGSKVVGPRWALLAPAILALAPLQSWFARDAYAELPLQVLALGGLWLFIEARRSGRRTTGAIAGVILGSITFVRIDALTVLIALPAALVVEHLRAASLEPAARALQRAVIWSFAVALGAIGVIGLIVSRALSAGYFHDLRSQFRELALALGAGVIAALGILVVRRVRNGLGHRLARNEIIVGSGTALTFAIALYAYVWRPRTTKPRVVAGETPVAARMALHAFYFTSSFRWFAWYLGIGTLLLAVIGFVVLGRRALRAESAASLLLAATVPVSILYIARPSISPDHLWAMRRYLPVVLPGMAIAASAAAMWLTANIAAWRPRLRAPFVIVAAVAMLLPAALAGIPLLRAQTQGGALNAVHELCAAAGNNAAIAVEPYGFLGAELPQTLRGFCGVPAAGLVANQPTALTTFAREWKRSGRQLYVATTARRPVIADAPRAVEVAHVVVADAHDPERTVTRPPRKYAPRRIEVWLYRVGPT